MMYAYTYGSDETPDHYELLGGQLPQQLTLYPGVYKWTTTVVLPVGATLTLQGNCGDVFVFIST